MESDASFFNLSTETLCTASCLQMTFLQFWGSVDILSVLPGVYNHDRQKNKVPGSTSAFLSRSQQNTQKAQTQDIPADLPSVSLVSSGGKSSSLSSLTGFIPVCLLTARDSFDLTSSKSIVHVEKSKNLISACHIDSCVQPAARVHMSERAHFTLAWREIIWLPQG